MLLGAAGLPLIAVRQPRFLLIAMALKHPNVYMSTCGHAPDHWPEGFTQFLKTRGKRKVIFGSNWPYIPYGRYFRKFAALELSPEAEQLFLRDNLLRLRNRTASGGASQFPDPSFPVDATTTLSQRGLVTPGSGATRYYSVFYRSPAATFCPPATANVTNGVRVLW